MYLRPCRMEPRHHQHTIPIQRSLLLPLLVLLDPLPLLPLLPELLGPVLPPQTLPLKLQYR